MEQVINVTNYGAGANKNCADAFNAAFQEAAKACLPLYIPELPNDEPYMLEKTAMWTSTHAVDVIANRAHIHWVGPDGYAAIVYGGLAGSKVLNARLKGLRLVNATTIGGDIGIWLQNLVDSDIDIEAVSNFDTDLYVLGNNGAFAYNRLRVLASSVDRPNSIAMSINSTGDKGWCNRNTVYDSRFSAATMLRAEGVYSQGWTFNGCAFEGKPGVFMNAKKALWWAFNDCWFEGGPFTWTLDNECHKIVVRGGPVGGLARPFPLCVSESI